MKFLTFTHSIVIIIFCVSIESCCINLAGYSCKPTAAIVLDNEHVSKRAGKLGNVYAGGLSCAI